MAIDLYPSYPRELTAPPEGPPPWPTTANGWAECIGHPIVRLLQFSGCFWVTYLLIKYGFLVLLIIAAFLS